MKLSYLLPLTFAACLPTGTGNPLQDASPGFDASARDAGGRYDASASDGGPSGDTGPALDGGPGADSGSDASTDAGLDASCPDAGPGCGVTGGPSCECLAGENIDLGEGRPLALADHLEMEGRLTLLRQRADAAGPVIESILITSDDGSAEPAISLASQVDHAAAAAGGDSFSVAYVPAGAAAELRFFDVAFASGTASAAEQVYTHATPVGHLAVARAGTTSTTAFVSAASLDPSEGESVFLHRVVDGVADVEISQIDVGTALNAIAVSAASESWLLAYATDTAVFTQHLDASGAAVGAPVEIAPAAFVSSLQLVTRDDGDGGFLLAFDGGTPAVHFLDAAGASSSSMSIVGRIVALTWAGGYAMSIRSDAATCSTSGSPLLFERFGVDLMPLHEPVRAGAGDAARVALVDDTPWVASAAGTALSLVSACVARQDK